MADEVTATIMPGLGREAEPILGGDMSNPTWDEYLAGFKEEWQPHIKAVRKAIEEANYVGITAENFCNDHWFKFSDGKALSFSWRAWGDLMQAIVGKREGYMTYYM